MTWIGLALALVVGLSLGLLGGGGSILTVPILVYVLGYGVKSSVAMSLAVVGTTSAVGAAQHGRAGAVNLRAVLGFAPMAMAGTFLGARLAFLLSGTAQLMLFAGTMLVAAGFMFRGRREPPATGRVKPAMLLLAAIGVAVGLLTGLVGVGGGFMIVPGLVLLAGLPMKEAVGSSLLIIALNALSGFAGYAGKVAVDWPMMLGFTAAAIVGVLIGGRLARRIAPDSLRRGFATFIVLVALAILIQTGLRGG